MKHIYSRVLRKTLVLFTLISTLGNQAQAQSCTPPTITSTLGTTVCENGTGALQATSPGGIVHWFDAPTGGNPIHVGSTFTPPRTQSTTTYYVSAGTTEDIGPTDQLYSSYNLTSPTVKFESNTSFILNSIDVTCQIYDTRTFKINLLNSANQVIQSTTTTVLGLNYGFELYTLNLGFQIEPGIYSIQMEGQTNLHVGYNNFPVSLGSVGNIIEAFSNGYSISYYYPGFVNWNISTCESTRSAVTITTTPNSAQAPVTASSYQIDPYNTTYTFLNSLPITGENLTYYSDPQLTNEIDEYSYVNAQIFYVTSKNGSCESEPVTVTICNISENETVYHQTICTEGTTHLYSNFGGMMKWFSSSESTQPVALSGYFETPVLTQNTVYYYQSYSPFENGFTTPSISNYIMSAYKSYANVNGQGVKLQLNESTYLNTFKLPYRNTSNAVIRLIITNTSNQSVVFTNNYSLPNNQGNDVYEEIAILKELAPGNYSITIEQVSGTAELIVMQGGVNYPLSMGTCGNITAGVENGIENTSTLFFITDLNYLRGCDGPRTSYEITIIPPLETPTYEQPLEICLNTQIGNIDLQIPNYSSTTFYNSGNLSYLPANTLINDLTSLTATYYNDGCISNYFNVPFTIISTPLPIAESPQLLQETSTVADIAVTGQDIKFYALANVVSPTQTVSGEMTYYVTQTIDGCESNKLPIIVNVPCVQASITSFANDTICAGESTSLTVTQNKGVVKWFDAEIDGNELYTGETFNTPLLNQSTTYYAEAITSGVAGDPINLSSGYTSSGTGNGMALKATKAFLLESVDVYVNTSGTIELKLLNELGQEINTKSISINVSGSSLEVKTLDLDFYITPGNYRLMINGNYSVFQEYYFNNYPVQIGAVGQITSSIAYTTPYNYFYHYHFYNIKYSVPCEVGERTPIHVEVNLIPETPVIASTLEACDGTTIENLTTDLNSLSWYSDEQFINYIDPSQLLQTSLYHLSKVENGCMSPSVAVDVTIHSIPSITVAEEQTYCGNSTTTAQLIDDATNTHWSIDGMAIENLSTSIQSATYNVYKLVNGCSSDTLAVEVTVIDIPTVPSSEILIGCANYHINQSPYYSPEYNWYNDEQLTQWMEQSNELFEGFYYVTISENGCTSEPLQVEVEIRPIPEAPVLNDQTFCQGAQISDIVVDAADPIFAQVDDLLDPSTVLLTGTYYVAERVNECLSTFVPIEITINQTVEPTGESTQRATEVSLISDIVVTGEALRYYTDADLTLEVNNDDVAIAGATYYVTQTINGCESAAIVITVTDDLLINKATLSEVKLYPNPVSSILTIEAEENISNIEILSVTGAVMESITLNATTTTMDLSNLARGVYLVKVSTEVNYKIVQVVKN